jgi:hypothetical protein
MSCISSLGIYWKQGSENAMSLTLLSILSLTVPGGGEGLRPADISLIRLRA